MRSSTLLGRQRSLQAQHRHLRSSTYSIARPLRVQVKHCRPNRPISKPSSRSAVHVVASLDYIATASDEGVLKLPARTELDPEEIKNVFGYPRCVIASRTHITHGHVCELTSGTYSSMGRCAGQGLLSA